MIITGMDLAGSVLWKNILHMTRMNIILRFRWDLPALYYSGRENPPHSEIWINYFLKMMSLYSKKVCELSKASEEEELEGSFSYLSAREKEFLVFLIKKKLYEFTPIDVSRMIGVTNKTVINRCAKLVKYGFLIPVIVNTRIRSFKNIK